MRYFPQFAESVRRNGGEARLAVRADLYPLIRRFAPDCVALEGHDFGTVDYTVGMMSMPRWIGLLPQQVEGCAYPDAAPERVDMWRRKLASDGGNVLRVGFVWAGSPTHRRDSQRSIPIDALAPLWDETQPWYDSVRLVRQRAPGDWAPVVDRVGAALSGWLVGRAAREDQQASEPVSRG
ncbi:hypothetical protein BTHE68_32060 [Burkholderia sp. THE68]|uniref:hypothetical protein n=1 Tax=Burkholderia sp. THE68 TaxID=758782 RepID=UPI001319A4DA|nr:hypothetical protein [Burkholderia sp. THE68]BBU29472.1 hypothetical protein BTHE68_32060 [Burkholderia sp. THE68]